MGRADRICLSFLIFSGDTARFFDRYFGLDKIIKFQRKFSLATAIFVALHPVFFMLSSQSVVNYLIPDFTIIPLASGITAFYLFIIVTIASQIYKRISYAIWQYIHLLIYLLFSLGLYHALKWGSDSDVLLVKILYGILLIAVASGIIYRTQYKIRKLFSGKKLTRLIKIGLEKFMF